MEVAKNIRFSRIYKTGTVPAWVDADSCSLQGRVSRLEQRNLLQFARVPTKLSGGFTAAFFLPILNTDLTHSCLRSSNPHIEDVEVLLLRFRADPVPAATRRVLFSNE